jgi:competence protein ComEA
VRAVLAPPAPHRRVDVDRATARELQALPGIGPALAARIVAYRDSNGPFGSLARLQQVKGIGPAKARKLDSLVTFSGFPRL